MDTQVATMTTKQVAYRLVELLRSGQFEEAQKELFAEGVVSTEPEAMPGMEKEIKGLDAVIEKGHHFMSTVEEVHGSVITEPVVIGNLISLGLGFDCTIKEKGRTNMEEIILYKVKDGKIVHEQFYY